MLTREQLIVLSPIHAVMEDILAFTDPKALSPGGRPPVMKGKGVGKQLMLLYQRLLTIHEMAQEACERDLESANGGEEKPKKKREVA